MEKQFVLRPMNCPSLLSKFTNTMCTLTANVNPYRWSLYDAPLWKSGRLWQTSTCVKCLEWWSYSQAPECTEEEFKKTFTDHHGLKTPNLTDYRSRLSYRDPKTNINTLIDEMWKMSTHAEQPRMIMGAEYYEAEGGSSSLRPKLISAKQPAKKKTLQLSNWLLFQNADLLHIGIYGRTPSSCCIHCGVFSNHGTLYCDLCENYSEFNLATLTINLSQCRTKTRGLRLGSAKKPRPGGGPCRCDWTRTE